MDGGRWGPDGEGWPGSPPKEPARRLLERHGPRPPLLISAPVVQCACPGAPPPTDAWWSLLCFNHLLLIQRVFSGCRLSTKRGRETPADRWRSSGSPRKRSISQEIRRRIRRQVSCSRLRRTGNI